MAAKKASKRKSTKRVTKAKPKAIKMAAKKVAGKMPSVREPMSKSSVIAAITDVTCLNRKDVVAVLDCLNEVIEKHIKTGGPGTFVMPGLMKIKVIKKPARKARKGVNPFTGEEIMIKAKPAYKAVKIKPLKKLKEMVA